MAEPLPQPLVPAEVDLRGYEFMPLHGELLIRSRFNLEATDAEFRAAINLWWSSWWETPAASLPNNEHELANLAACKNARAWRSVRERVMEKWVLCDDNRWYHPILADMALRSWAKRKSAATKGRVGAQKRWGIKDGPHAPAMNPPPRNNGSGNATANSSTTKPDSTGNSKRSEVVISNTVSRNDQRPVGKTASERKAQQQLAEQAQHERTRADPPGGSVAELVQRATGKPLKPSNGHDEAEEPDATIDAPEPTPRQAFRLGDDLPPTWRESSDGIDHAGQTLGMARLAFEPDEAYAGRIDARLSLDRPT